MKNSWALKFIGIAGRGLVVGFILTISAGASIAQNPSEKLNLENLPANEIIQKGAKLVTHSQDILEDLMPQLKVCAESWQPKKRQPHLPRIAQQEKKLPNLKGDPVLTIVREKPQSFDQILVSLEVPPASLQRKLLELELLGELKRGIGGLYELP